MRYAGSLITLFTDLVHCHLPEKSRSSTAGNNGAPTSVPLSLGHALYLVSDQAGNEDSSTVTGKDTYVSLLLKIQSIVISERKMGDRNRLENQKS